MPPKVVKKLKLVPAPPPPSLSKKTLEKPVDKSLEKPLTKTVEVHKCVMCEKVMGSKQELQDHFRLHANSTIDMKGNQVKPLVKNTLSSNSSPQPKKVGGDVKVSSQEISCDVCQETFAAVTSAIQHKFRKHPNSNVKYYCGFCGKQFPLEICKINHIKSDHSKDKRTNKLYKCKDCTAEFFKEEAIKFHIRSSHVRVTALMNPITTMGPSKKIKMNISGELSSVYYCQLCGQEYMVKFNLQKHLEANHSQEERTAPPEQLIKCKLCDALFYNKKAWESHNMLHTPKDLYIDNEADRLKAVARVDQDFDQSRVPTFLERLLPVDKPKPMVSKPIEEDPLKMAPTDKIPPLKTASSGGGSKNRAVVDSDSEDDKSDTSIESDDEAVKNKPPPKKKLKKVQK